MFFRSFFHPYSSSIVAIIDACRNRNIRRRDIQQVVVWVRMLMHKPPEYTTKWSVGAKPKCGHWSLLHGCKVNLGMLETREHERVNGGLALKQQHPWTDVRAAILHRSVNRKQRYTPSIPQVPAFQPPQPLKWLSLRARCGPSLRHAMVKAPVVSLWLLGYACVCVFAVARSV